MSDLLPILICVPQGSIREMHKWDKETIISYLIMCDLNQSDYDYDILFRELNKCNVPVDVFFSSLKKLDIDFEECRKDRLNEKNKPNQRHERKFNPDCLYLIKNPANGLIKIGVTGNLEQRYKQLCREQMVELEIINYWEIKNALDFEKEFIDVFDEHKIVGEWFDAKVEKEAKQYISNLINSASLGRGIE